MSKPKVFISYCHVDEAPWKNRLQKHLEVLDRRGSLSFWEDRQIAAGSEWRAEISAALESAEAAILLISVDFLRSKFIRDEEVPAILQRRMQKGMRVFPLLLRSCPWQKEEWLSRLQVRPTDGKPLAQFDKDDDIDRVLAEFASEIETLLNHTPAPIIAVPTTNQECPYLGLEAFTEDKRHLFFGRDNFIEAIWQKLQERQFVAVVGPSGCGKSSVIQAGVFPRLGNDWRKLVFQPGEAPFFELAAKLVELGGVRYPHRTAFNKAAETVAQQIRENGSIAATGAETLAALPPPSRLLLVADQFEELFTLTPVADRQPFVEALLAAAHLAELKVLVTLRADFFGQAISLTPELSQLLQDGLVTHRPLQRADWEAVILQPAKTVGLHVDPALVALILEEIEAQPDSLPLLEYALTELWQQRTPNGIGLAQYEAIGRLAGAINQRADTVLAQLSEEDQKLALRALTRLVRVSGGEEEGADTRLRLPLNELTAEQRAVLQSFITERLLVTNRHDRTGEETIEVAHEALIRRWEKLRKALDEDREFLVWRRRLDFWRKEWEHHHRDNSLLLRGPFLLEAKSRIQRHLDLTVAEIEFITWEDRPEFQIDCVLSSGKKLALYSDQTTVQKWVSALSLCNHIDLATEICTSLETPADKCLALIAVANAVIKLKQQEVAKSVLTNVLSLVSEVRAVQFRDQILYQVVKAAVKATINGMAESIVCEIEEPKIRAFALQCIASKAARSGDVTKARSYTQKIDHLDDRDRAWLFVAAALVRAKKIPDALHCIPEIASPSTCENGFGMIAEELAKVGKYSNSFSTIDKIKDDKYRVDVLCSIALALKKKGKVSQACKALVLAKLAADRLTSLKDRRNDYLRISNIYKAIGRSEESQEIWREVIVLDPGYAAEFAALERNFKYYQENESLAERITRDDLELDAHSRILYMIEDASHLFQDKRFSESEKLTEEIKQIIEDIIYDESRSNALLNLSEFLSK